MPDFSKCANESCPLRFECYRYRAVDSVPIQSYTDFQYHEDAEGNANCNNFKSMQNNSINAKNNN